MKIQCQSCQAKYTIADEKVLGKVVKIRCKKCSATIVINGNEARAAEDNADTHVFDYAAGQSNEQWTVNVADGDQRTMTVGEIVAEYKAGTINDETYCWKDGMADWLPLREIEQLYGAINLGPRPSLADDISVPPQSSPAAALFAPAPGGDSLFSGNDTAHANGNGALFGGESAAPAAARRGGGRGQGADLFGNAATAGGEDDVMTSAAKSGGGGGGVGAGGAGMDAEKLTGQRNENSVLFSLSALTDSAKGPENKTTATADGSGLIDIRALSASMGDSEKKDKGSRVDDIMNLSGGGAFGAALAAPILAPPPLETVDPNANAGAGAGNKTLLFGLLGAGAFVMVGIIVAVMMLRGGDEKKVDATTAMPSSPASAVAQNDVVNPNGAPTPTAEATPDKPSTPPSTEPTPAAPGTGAAKPSSGSAKASSGSSKPSGGTAAAEAPAPAAAPAPAKPASFGDALAAAAGKPKDERPSAPSGGGSSAPFDRGAAAAALGGVNVQACKKPDGPTGSGHVKVTFAPDGSVSSAVVDGGPFPGTAVGGCIAGKYRGARVPAFSGAPVSVGKSFTVN